MSFNKYDPLPPIEGGENNMALTNYRVDYHPHPLERPFQHQPEPYMKPQGDFANKTSYNQEYTGKLEAENLFKKLNISLKFKSEF